ncbi:hypothetical protein PDIG_64430 [Penicillium digitatum PHI26]|uniref:Uncharacterized protein n=2 Tax=Penicillium digitatum TaxID=36651 RepID=K9G2D3_PEND2|nr:hypothetical protein PDIP_73770 [Penicillium digitatum Pd1]EKV07500.1 hypothetical protein PDIP_73770 [Penicillium digitatum Pd1]EKV09043.1 hypothetical protein PDIG_64430 [Penicillium digitatum PHI26]
MWLRSTSNSRSQLLPTHISSPTGKTSEVTRGKQETTMRNG